MGFEAWDNVKLSRSTTWIKAYKWPVYCFIAVAFWNLVGAGIFGFLINPPIALYYMQGLNTTPVHGHTALFGVYGMLGIGLMLFVLRDMNKEAVWKEKVDKICLLEHKHWSGSNGSYKCSADRSCPDSCECKNRIVVCTICRIHAVTGYAYIKVA